MALTEQAHPHPTITADLTLPRPQVVAAPAQRSRFNAALVALDAAALLGVWLAILWLVGDSTWMGAVVTAGLVTGVGLFVAAQQRLYDERRQSVSVLEARRILRVALIPAACVMAVPLPVDVNAWAVAAIGAVASFLALAATRGCVDEWMRAERADGRHTRPVVIIGTNGEAGELLRLVTSHPELGYRVFGVVGDEIQAVEHGVRWLGRVDDAVELVASSGVRDVIVTPNGTNLASVNLLLRGLFDLGAEVHLSSGFAGVGARRIRAVSLAHEPFVRVEARNPSLAQRTVKRALDIVGAALVLVLALPVLAVVSLAIKLEDRGPVFFRQLRVGLAGRTFTLLKLRTMVTDAESRLGDMAADNERHGPLFKVASDARVTRIGRLLRATSIDEIPQLWNVLRGDMSLVGPRPALPHEVAVFDVELYGRHRVRPGVTGLWQIEARDNPSFYAYRHLDLFYVDNWSPLLDLGILLRTGPSVLVRAIRGAVGRSEPVPTA